MCVVRDGWKCGSVEGPCDVVICVVGQGCVVTRACMFAYLCVCAVGKSAVTLCVVSFSGLYAVISWRSVCLARYVVCGRSWISLVYAHVCEFITEAL